MIQKHGCVGGQFLVCNQCIFKRFLKINLQFGEEENALDTWVSRRVYFIKISKYIS